MIEVIPNWHPLLVHFPIALLSMATLFFIAMKIAGDRPIEDKLRTLAYWNLWSGTGFAIAAVIAGWFAFNSVSHDTPSHAAMTVHRNWALVTLVSYILISIWSFFYYKNEKKVSIIFTLTMVLAFVLLVSTGWRGSEVVYRYGLGVMSMPKAEGDGHAHEHSNDVTNVPASNKESLNEHDAIEHEHSNREMKSSSNHNDTVNSHDDTNHKH